MLSSVPGTPTDQRIVDNANHPPEYNFHFEYVSIRYKKCPQRVESVDLFHRQLDPSSQVQRQAPI